MTISSTKSKIRFFSERQRFTLKNRTKLKRFLEAVFKKEGQKLRYLSFIFTSDKRVLEINRQFLDHDYYTDIISFEMGQTDYVEGEIYISIERVRENAKNLGHPFNTELLRIILHGVLHLCGYSDKSKVQQKKMGLKEDFYLAKIKV